MMNLKFFIIIASLWINKLFNSQLHSSISRFLSRASMHMWLLSSLQFRDTLCPIGGLGGQRTQCSPVASSPASLLRFFLTENYPVTSSVMNSFHPLDFKVIRPFTRLSL